VGLDIRYARSGGVAIAYAVVGDGETDLVYIPDFVSNLVYGWESGRYRAFYEGLSRSFRLILFDKRGTGLSDLGGHFPSLETRMDDVRAVLDAVESESAVVFGSHDGCSMAALYAATYPERTRALVLFHPVAYDEWGQSDAAGAELVELRERWGTREYCDEILREAAPSLYSDPEAREWFANMLRVGASPSVAYALNRAWTETDLREVLPAVRVPTLVLYRPLHEEHAAEVARLIRDARTLRVSGEDYSEAFLSPEIPEEIERFVAGEVVPEVPDTVLATVLFTLIVASSERAAEMGDRGRRLLRDVRRARAGDPLRACDRRRRARARARGARRRPHRGMRGARGQGRRPRGRDRRAGRRGRGRRRGARLADRQGSRSRRGDRVRRARRAGAQGRSRHLAPLLGRRRHRARRRFVAFLDCERA
jgi:pimeloyl-ACP methyl ester carboxylesterase